jgi:hypothetical protein
MTTRTTRLAFCLLSLFLLGGCATSYSPLHEYIPARHEIKVTTREPVQDSISMLYVTCGMMIFQHGHEAFMLDPFFSYQRFSDFITGIKPRKKFYENFKHLMDTSSIDRNAVRTAFISHTHYDHLMDLPLLMHDRYFPNLKTVFGNSFVPDMLFHSKNNVINIKSIDDNQLYNPLSNNEDKNYEWLNVSDSMQVLPIASRHAPQKKGVLMMNSGLDTNYFRKEKFKDPYARSRSSKWDAGCNYAFLVRFLKRDGTYFKILIQTSASNPPYGLPPTGEKADIAVLCFASLQEVEDYPAYLIKNTGAKKLILVHWEDFFRHPKNTGDVKLVRVTNKKIAKTRLKQVEALPQRPEVLMPKPGTFISIGY